MSEETEAIYERFDTAVGDLMRDCIGRAVARKVPGLSAEQVVQIQDAVMDQIVRFGVQYPDPGTPTISQERADVIVRALQPLAPDDQVAALAGQLRRMLEEEL